MLDFSFGKGTYLGAFFAFLTHFDLSHGMGSTRSSPKETRRFNARFSREANKKAAPSTWGAAFFNRDRPNLVFQQTTRDHLSLDFTRTFKDVQDTGICQYAADRIFQRKAVATMDLQGIVGSCPRHAGGQ